MMPNDEQVRAAREHIRRHGDPRTTDEVDVGLLATLLATREAALREKWDSDRAYHAGREAAAVKERDQYKALAESAEAWALKLKELAAALREAK